VVAAPVATGLLGLVLSALFGVEIKTAPVIGVPFIIAHVGIGPGLDALFAA
jgi:hypothetical protein